MDVSRYDLLNMASRSFILGAVGIDDQMTFIKDQIKHPFDTSSTNYFKKLRKMVQDPDMLDEYCKEILEQIEARYPNIEFNIEDMDEHLADFTDAVYKFFVKNIKKLTYIFLREYIFNNKNRKNLVAEHMNIKLPNYPKEQYGKKENYILISKLSNIIDEICEEPFKLSTFISYLRKVDDVKLFIDFIERDIENGVIFDHGIYSDIMKVFDDSDAMNSILNKLQIDITDALIIPYIEELGLETLRFGIIDPETDGDLEDGETDEDDE